MPRADVLFRNRMGMKNWALIVLGFVLAGVLLVAQGDDLVSVALICGGLALASLITLIVIIAVMGRSHVAELVESDAGLAAEMLSPFGRGRVISMPLAEIEDWRVTRVWPSVRFRYAGREFVLPLSGAQVDWPALRRVAPDMREVVR